MAVLPMVVLGLKKNWIQGSHVQNLRDPHPVYISVVPPAPPAFPSFLHFLQCNPDVRQCVCFDFPLQ